MGLDPGAEDIAAGFIAELRSYGIMALEGGHWVRAINRAAGAGPVSWHQKHDDAGVEKMYADRIDAVGELAYNVRVPPQTLVWSRKTSLIVEEPDLDEDWPSHIAPRGISTAVKNAVGTMADSATIKDGVNELARSMLGANGLLSKARSKEKTSACKLETSTGAPPEALDSLKHRIHPKHEIFP